MADGDSADAAKAMLSAKYQATSYVETAVWIQLHLGPPGPAGTDNPCLDTTRIDASACFGTDPTDDGTNASISNDAPIGPWPTAGAESPTHASKWSLASGGQFNGSGALTGLDVDTIPVGGFTHLLPIAS